MLPLPFTPLNDAVMTDVPAATAVTRPDPLTVATPAFELLHVTVELTSADVPSLYAAVALNWALLPATASSDDGATEMDVIDFFGLVGLTRDVLLVEQPVTVRTNTTGKRTHHDRVLFGIE
jgi:hypothetical protein